jgi:hypothetical protein
MDCSLALKVKVNPSPVSSLMVSPIPPTSPPTAVSTMVLLTPGTYPETPPLHFDSSKGLGNRQALTTNGWQDLFENLDNTYCPVKASSCQMTNIVVDCGHGSDYIGHTESCPVDTSDLVGIVTISD